ncbi:MAG: transcription antitermination factor NusB [Lachnospiraceae bacterium]|jgi:transcription antitermination factor NusB|nr:transcription antitermination factor NusB [Lachnospiraceae bacterium]
MSRREIREQIFKLLFRAEFYEGEELEEQCRLFFEELGQEDAKDTEYIQSKYEDVLSHITEIDAMVNEVAQGWKTSRMGKVDLTLIRLAVYEMKFEEDVPQGVAINEAVELAKSYGTDDSSSFVNGILAKLV